MIDSDLSDDGGVIRSQAAIPKVELTVAIAAFSSSEASVPLNPRNPPSLAASAVAGATFVSHCLTSVASSGVAFLPSSAEVLRRISVAAYWTAAGVAPGGAFVNDIELFTSSAKDFNRGVCAVFAASKITLPIADDSWTRPTGPPGLATMTRFFCPFPSGHIFSAGLNFDCRM
jgi:hypothetical protein